MQKLLEQESLVICCRGLHKRNFHSFQDWTFFIRTFYRKSPILLIRILRMRIKAMCTTGLVIPLW